ncbi:hypothetical protein [Acidithrix sp. C25]|uniref:hypothetical protein n=1 Tax=Acidithrix sp. C25 TaxID=1671482 RepID=UPI000A9E98A7|nr:hypothetical protein [Acidithrix sp. C25]CAG4930701.1 unnamed protein product [Acidithrix sp. C25]
MAFDLATRILEGDNTIWGPNSVAPNRLGWIHLIERTQEFLDDLRSWSESIDQSKIVVLGMGGSSLGPRVFYDFTKRTNSAIREIVVIDSTDPRGFADLDITDAAFIVSSKSGTTVESEALFRFFRGRQSNPKRFIAITDPGSPLEAMATELGFSRVFSTPQNVGGRFSVFSEFGLVPGILAGIDIVELLSAAQKTDSGKYVELGETLGANANSGIPFVSIEYESDDKRSIGMWTEQILAESTGKEDKGLVPVPHRSKEGTYPTSNLIVECNNVQELGQHLYGMQLATAAAGYSLGIDPFNEPDVGVSKEITRRVLAGEKFNPTLEDLECDQVESYISDRSDEGKYFALSAYQPLGFEDELYAWRDDLAKAIATSPITAGLAPRHLHSTGQLHKGGPKTLELIQVVSKDYGPKVTIPDMDTDFGTLIRAQADGDAIACQNRGQKVSRLYL